MDNDCNDLVEEYSKWHAIQEISSERSKYTKERMRPRENSEIIEHSPARQSECQSEVESDYQMEIQSENELPRSTERLVVLGGLNMKSISLMETLSTDDNYWIPLPRKNVRSPTRPIRPYMRSVMIDAENIVLTGGAFLKKTNQVCLFGIVLILIRF